MNANSREAILRWFEASILNTGCEKKRDRNMLLVKRAQTLSSSSTLRKREPCQTRRAVAGEKGEARIIGGEPCPAGNSKASYLKKGLSRGEKKPPDRAKLKSKRFDGTRKKKEAEGSWKVAHLAGTARLLFWRSCEPLSPSFRGRKIGNQTLLFEATFEKARVRGRN